MIGMKKSILTYFLSALSLFILITSPIGAESFAIWLDSNVPSPCFRPTDLLKVAKNGFLASAGTEQTLKVLEHPVYGKYLHWRVKETGDGARQEPGYAVTRVQIPKYAQNKAVGIRLALYSEKRTRFRIDLYTNVPGQNFNNAWLLGSAPVETEEGFQEKVFRFSEITESNETIEGFGFSATDELYPVEVGILRVDLAFDDAKTAKEIEQYSQKTTIRCLKARGLDITNFIDQLSYYELEKKIWQATNLLAIREQLDYWSKLAKHCGKPDKIGPSLERKRQDLARRLQNGQNISDEEIGGLQKDSDSYAEYWMQTLTFEQRSFYLGEDKKFHYPDGRPYRMFGPHLHRMDSYVPLSDGWIPWDIRHIAALGFTGIRFAVPWENLEPEQGKLNLQLLESLISLARECEKFGLGLSADLHFPRPRWFAQGKPGFENNPNAHTLYGVVYHWPDALAESWCRFASAIKKVPNVVAWEVPANEPLIVDGVNGISSFPSLVKSWNRWLKQTYKTREALKEAWSHNYTGDKRFELTEEEDWDKNSIKWMVVEEKPDPDFNYQWNPRLWDHLRWVAETQATATTLIMDHIRKSHPKAVGIMHMTVGGIWDKSPVPLDYYAIEIVRGKNVNPGTHYGVGGKGAKLAAAQSYASYDTEQVVHNNWENVKKHVSMGLGFCPFWYSASGYEYEPLLDNAYAHIHEAVAYLFENADWIRNYWPSEKKGQKVAIVENTRLEAIKRSRTGSLEELLEKLGYSAEYFTALDVARNPHLLENFYAAITPSTYLDPDFLAALKNRYKGKVLFHGAISIDAYGRKAEKGAAEEFRRNGIFLKKSQVPIFPQAEDFQSLEREWDFAFVGNIPGYEPRLLAGNEGYEWIKMKVPSPWAESGALPFVTAKNVVGYGWYKKEIVFPSNWKSKTFKFSVGTIDDYAHVFINGKLIGYLALGENRAVQIPKHLIKWDELNEVSVLVNNVAGNGGIIDGPVGLILQDGVSLIDENGVNFDVKGEISLGMMPSKITKELLLPSTEIKVWALSGNEKCAAYMKQGRFSWWISDSQWSVSDLEEKVLNEFLCK